MVIVARSRWYLMMLEKKENSALVLYGGAVPSVELMDKWYVLFIKTGIENIICDYINLSIDTNNSRAFYPKIESFFKTSKIIKKKIKPLYPGYIFIKSTIDPQDFLIMIQPIITHSRYYIKLLNKYKPESMVLNEKEKDRITKYCDENYIIKKSIGIKEGDKIEIISGPLKGCESEIKRIDRHKMRAEVEIEFMGDIRRVNLPLEVVQKQTKSNI